jgi:hypothetical protein
MIFAEPRSAILHAGSHINGTILTVCESHGPNSVIPSAFLMAEAHRCPGGCLREPAHRPLRVTCAVLAQCHAELGRVFGMAGTVKQAPAIAPASPRAAEATGGMASPRWLLGPWRSRGEQRRAVRLTAW